MRKLEAWSLYAATHCVRNTYLEDLHSGVTPCSKKGDYSDVKVVTPYGDIPWNQLSRISDEEMRTLMMEITDNLDAFLLLYTHKNKSKKWLCMLKRIYKNGPSWNNKLVEKFIKENPCKL